MLKNIYSDQRNMTVTMVLKVTKRVLVEDSTPYYSVSMKQVLWIGYSFSVNVQRVMNMQEEP